MEFKVFIQAKKRTEIKPRFDIITMTGTREQVLIDALEEAKKRWPESEGFKNHKAELNK